jgi:hypothetical protein
MINQDYYEDLSSAFIKATPSVKGSRLLDASELRSGEAQKPSEEKFIDIVTGTRAKLDQQYHERLYQAHTTFIIALATLVLGILLIFVGVILTFIISLPTGIVTAASSIVVEIVSALAFTFYKNTNDRLDSLQKELSFTESTLVLVDHISDPKTRNKAIIDLIGRIPSFDPNAATSLIPPDASQK